MQIRHIVKSVAAVCTAATVLREQCGFSNKLLRELKYGGVLMINGVSSRLKTRVRTGDELICDLPFDCASINANSEIQILYETPWWIAVYKPAGMITHPTTGHPDNTLTDLLSDDALSPVTRLDKHTSGIVLIAKCGHSHHQLSKIAYDKIYLGVVEGLVDSESGIIDAPIGRSDFSYLTRIVHPLGKTARTGFWRIATNEEENVSLLAFQLYTGRTHQIRVHQLWEGYPLVGDMLYGSQFLSSDSLVQRPPVRFFRLDWPRDYSEYPVSRVRPGRCIDKNSDPAPKHCGQYLHCYQLNFCDPFSQQQIEIKAEIPIYFNQYFSTETLNSIKLIKD